MKLERLTIPSGANSLAALHYQPDCNPCPLSILYTHGFTAGKYSMDSLASYLAGKGYAGVAFDLIGHKSGGSTGKLERMSQAPECLRDVLRYCETQLNFSQTILLGHSLGAASSLQVAVWEKTNPESSVSGVVAMCMGSEPARGFETPVGKAMLSQREAYIDGAPALPLLHELADIVHALPQIELLPALFIAAKQDVLVPPDRVQAFANRVAPHAALAEIESSHLDAPDKAKTAIVRWLENQHSNHSDTKTQRMHRE